MFFVLYILKNSPLSDMSFKNIYSQAVACLFILLMLSLAEQKAFILMKTSFSITAFTHYALVLDLRRLHSTHGRLVYFLCSSNFIDLYFTFGSLVHFQLMCVKAVRSVSKFLFLSVYVQLFQIHLLKSLSLFHCLCSFGKDCIYEGPFLDSPLFFTDVFV